MKKLNVVAISTLFVFLVIAAMPGLGLADVYYTCINKMSGARRQVCGNNCGSMEVARATTTTCASTTSPPAASVSGIIHGTVSAEYMEPGGWVCTIVSGTGFTVDATNACKIVIFNTPFGGKPDCTVTTVSNPREDFVSGATFPMICQGWDPQPETLEVWCFSPYYTSNPAQVHYWNSVTGTYSFQCVY
jgi:hypothetical protein